MKKIWKIVSLLLITFLILFVTQKVFANENVRLVADKTTMIEGEEFKVTIQLSDTSVAAFTVQIYFDSSKIEYLSGPESSNYANSRIVYTWFDESGGITPIQNGEIGEFNFRAKEEGEAKLVIFGEYYDEKGNSLEINSSSSNIEIKKEQSNEENINDIVEENVSKDNAYLKIMRLNEEGISPSRFDKNVMEYYFIADKSIDNLEVTAVPENSKSTVKISGNQNIKEGLNEIKIEVISEDRTNTKLYTIHVTKTANLESANANLENLAIENITLNPEFQADITEYKVEVSNEVETLNILAVPEKINAKVVIDGKDNLQIGNNTSIVTVTAENGFTTKKYKIQVYRRNEQEEIEYQKQNEIQAQKLSTILEEQETNEEEDKMQDTNTETTEEKNKSYGIISLIVVVIVGAILIIWLKKLQFRP